MDLVIILNLNVQQWFVKRNVRNQWQLIASFECGITTNNLNGMQPQRAKLLVLKRKIIPRSIQINWLSRMFDIVKYIFDKVRFLIVHNICIL